MFTFINAEGSITTGKSQEDPTSEDDVVKLITFVPYPLLSIDITEERSLLNEDTLVETRAGLGEYDDDPRSTVVAFLAYCSQ